MKGKKSRGKEKLAVVLIILLWLTGIYAGYGRYTAASEMEGESRNRRTAVEKTEWQRDTQNQMKIRGEKYVGETENETESESESEVESEIESEIYRGTESESESKAETEKLCETDMTEGSESETENITETEEMSEGEMEISGEISETEIAGCAEIETEVPEKNMETGTEENRETESLTEHVSEKEIEKESENSLSEENTESTGEQNDLKDVETELCGKETETEKKDAETDIAQTESEPENNMESEINYETETTETESESERDSEPESETEIESESETETETVTYEIYIRHIAAVVPPEGRVYDGTDQIELHYEIEWPDVLKEEDRRLLQSKIECKASLDCCDTGERKVNYTFHFPEDPKDVSEHLEWHVEETEITVNILPRVLKVHIPDGWKLYGRQGGMEEVHLLGPVTVSGFLKDEEGRDIVPPGFQVPETELVKELQAPYPDILVQGQQKEYREALVVRCEADGTPSGNPTENYCFSLDEGSDHYRKGSLVIAQSEAEEGRDYEVYGDEGASYRDENGVWWVKEGSGLHIRPLDVQAYDKGADLTDLRQSGSETFQLTRTDRQGNVTAASLEAQVSFRVDRQAAEADIHIGNAAETGETFYGKKDVAVRFEIPQDQESGIRAAKYFAAASEEAVYAGFYAGEELWQDCIDGMELMLSEEGSYVIYVMTEDRVGNRAFAKSNEIVVDETDPILRIEGVEDRSANGGSIVLHVSCEDAHYRKGSLEISLTGANGGKEPERKEETENEQGASVIFGDFPTGKTYDDLYTLKVSAEDLAGNKTEKEMTFSVNRYGSVYDLDENTKQELSTFYHTGEFPVTFLETNLDYVKAASVWCRKDGETYRMEQGVGYERTLQEEKNGWKQYRYTVSSENFREEGTYEVMLMSTDQASNSSDSQTQKKSVCFAIDHSAPECLISGIEADGIYQDEERWICIEPRDNGALKKTELYLDGELQNIWNGEITEEIIKWKVQSQDHWQRLQIYMEDEAGNGAWTEEISFFLTGTALSPEQVPPYERKEKSARELQDEKKKKAESRVKGKNEEADLVSVRNGGKTEETSESRKIKNMRREDKWWRLFLGIPGALAGAGLFYKKIKPF